MEHCCGAVRHSGATPVSGLVLIMTPKNEITTPKMRSVTPKNACREIGDILLEVVCRC